MMETPAPQKEIRCIRDVEVAKKLSIGRSTVWFKLKGDADFPKPFALFPEGRTTVWLEHEIDAFIASKAQRH